MSLRRLHGLLQAGQGRSLLDFGSPAGLLSSPCGGGAGALFLAVAQGARDLSSSWLVTDRAFSLGPGLGSLAAAPRQTRFLVEWHPLGFAGMTLPFLKGRKSGRKGTRTRHVHSLGPLWAAQLPYFIPESMDTTALSLSVCLLICKVEVTWILIASSHHPAPTSHTHL